MVRHQKGHKNSKGETAEWVIVSHKDGHIISSHKTKAEAEKHLTDIRKFKHMGESMKLDEAKKILNENGYTIHSKKLLTETTALSSPESILSDAIWGVFHDFKEDCDKQGNEDNQRLRQVADDFLEALNRIENMPEQEWWDDIIEPFLSKLGLIQVFDKAWDKYHGRI